jgi:hypothetical protein
MNGSAVLECDNDFKNIGAASPDTATTQLEKTSSKAHIRDTSNSAACDLFMYAKVVSKPDNAVVKRNVAISLDANSDLYIGCKELPRCYKVI